MKLIDFWPHLSQTWDFERNISNDIRQTGILHVIKINQYSYKAFERGVYLDSPEQTFFRHYNFSWISNSWHIYGANPKEGYVLLYQISENCYSYVHQCGNDSYYFELLNFSKNSWQSIVTVIGPYKNFKIATYYKLTKN